MIGTSFGRLTVISIAGRSSNNQLKYKCQCLCGQTTIVRKSNLTDGHTKSCGCYRRELGHIKNLSHGGVGSDAYGIWESIKKRCCNPKSKNWENYGGRGITICDRWKDDYGLFLKDMGERPFKGAQIDRIDNNKGYEPENCRWTTSKNNNRNRRNNTMIEFKGQSRCLAEWAEIMGLKQGTLLNRIRKGWAMEDAMMPIPNGV